MRRSVKLRLKKRKSMYRLMFLLILAAISTTVIGSSQFKFISTLAKSDSIQVAKWEVAIDDSDVTNNSNNMDLVAGGSAKSYKIIISNTSNVGVNYSINLTNLPNGIYVGLDNNPLQLVTDNRITFNDVGIINAQNETTENVEHTIIFQVPLEVDEIEDNEVGISVIFNQIVPE